MRRREGFSGEFAFRASFLGIEEDAVRTGQVRSLAFLATTRVAAGEKGVAAGEKGAWDRNPSDPRSSRQGAQPGSAADSAAKIDRQ
jgi:hypothetical protein